MSLSVGTDSYVTLSEAEELVGSYFTSSDTTRVAWDAASDTDKEVALRRSCKAINSLSYVGSRKFAGDRATAGQRFEFPRKKGVVAGVSYIPFVPQTFDIWVDQDAYKYDGLDDAKLAQVVNAVYCIALTGTKNEVLDINVRGLTSRKVGPTAETYNTKGNTYNSDIMIGIYTKEVYSILKEWINGTRYSF